MPERMFCSAAAPAALRFAVAQHQINLPVVRGGEHAVGAQVEDGKIGLVRVAECVVHGGLQVPDGADGASSMERLPRFSPAPTSAEPTMCRLPETELPDPAG